MRALALAAAVIVACSGEVYAGGGIEPRVMSLVQHLKHHYVYRDFNDYGAVAYGKVFEIGGKTVNVYYADLNENHKVDQGDSIRIVDMEGRELVNYVDNGLDGLVEAVGELNSVGSLNYAHDAGNLSEEYLRLVQDLLSSR
jgi:hypothetical protein